MTLRMATNDLVYKLIDKYGTQNGQTQTGEVTQRVGERTNTPSARGRDIFMSWLYLNA